MKNRIFAALVCAGMLLGVCVGALAQEQTAYKPVLNRYADALRAGVTAESDVNILCLYAGAEMDAATPEDVGYALVDLDGNGVTELVIGCCRAESWLNHVMFEVYTIQEGQAVLMLESWERCRRTLSEEGYIVTEGSSGSANTTVERSRIASDGQTLEFVDAVVRDVQMDEENPWFHVTAGQQGVHEYIPITEEEAEAMLETFLTVSGSVAYTPFSAYSQE